MTRIRALVFWLIFSPSFAYAQGLDFGVSGFWNWREADRGFRITSRKPVELAGIQFGSSDFILNTGSSPAPFQFFIPGANESHQRTVALGNLGSTVTLDGEMELDVFLSRDSRCISPPFVMPSVWATYSSGMQPIGFIMHLECRPRVVPQVFAKYPIGGGPVTVTATEAVRVESIDFDSLGMNLLSSGSDPTPFGRYFGPLNATGLDYVGMHVGTTDVNGVPFLNPAVMVDGSVVLDVYVLPNAEGHEIVGTFGVNTFDVHSDVFGFAVTAVPEPSAAWMIGIATLLLFVFRARRVRT